MPLNFGPIAPDAPGQGMRRLVTLRWVLLAAELGLYALGQAWVGGHASWLPVLAIASAQLGLNLASATRAPGGDPGPTRLLTLILLDVAALTGITWFAGGPANPLAGLYLLWIAAGATLLDGRRAAFLAAACIGAYSLLTRFHAPVHIHDPALALDLHLGGMWITFVFSALTIGWSVSRLTGEVRRRDAELAAAREAALRDERVLALGNLAAGAAHELGTPLATMAILAGEVRDDPRLAPGLREDLVLLSAQVADCKRIITGLVAASGGDRAEALAPVCLRAWIDALLARWRLQRPQVVPALHFAPAGKGPDVTLDETLGQALLNLLNNAADASPASVELVVQLAGGKLHLQVLDRGPGLDAHRLPGLGVHPQASRSGGLGLGLLLAQTAVVRSGGRLAFHAREGGGTCVQLELPIAEPAHGTEPVA
jgi:two-component system sensor histidine kinase RegB